MVLFHASVCVFIYSIQANYRLIPMGAALIVGCLIIFLIGRFDHWDEVKVTHVGLLELVEETTTAAFASTGRMTDGSAADNSCSAN